METKNRIAQYIHRPLTPYCKGSVVEYARSLGLNRALVDDMHVTLVYTKTPMDMPKLDTSKLFLPSSFNVEIWETQNNGDVAVLVLNDILPLQDRVEYFRGLGATSDFPTYKAHISLSYDIPVGFTEFLKNEPQIGFKTFVFDGEEYEDVYEEWKPKGGK